MVDTNIKNILLIGRTGGGKSTLANVLLNKNEEFEEVFRESSSGVSETRDLQIELLEIKLDEEGKEKVSYRIVDTVGVGDTKIDPQGVLWKLARIAHELRDGLNQILFVTKGRFTKEEAEAYDLLSSIIFDSEVVKYTTIVRTGFHNFLDEKKCEADRQKLKEENPTIAHIFKEVRKIIYVDNPPMEGYYLEMAKKVRQESRKRLLTYLGTCLDTYHPSNLATLNERIGDYMTNEEKLIKEMEKLEKIRKEQEEKFREEMAELKKQQEKKLKEMKEKNEKDINDVREKSKEELRKSINDLEDKRKKDMDELERKNKEREQQAEERHRQEIRSANEANERRIQSFQEEMRQSKSQVETLRSQLAEKNNSSSNEVASDLAKLNLSNKNQDSDEWKVRIKELEIAENNAKRAHDERMQELRSQKKENDAKVVSQTQTYVEERRPGVTAGLAGAGATIGSAFGPLGTVVGGVGGWLIEKIL